MRKTWRHDRAITEEQIAARHFAFCPACIQMSRREGQGRVTITGKRLKAARVEIERRINNAAAAASRTQPERRIISMGATDSGDGLDVITTSQKLAHRIAHEVKKAFGGRATYDWKDDGTLRAAVDLDARK
jgi:NMD protein affecting ribosome stability and mRNA decay